MEGSTGGDKVEVIFTNCSVLSLNRKALLILFRFILHKNTKNITTLYNGILQVKKIKGRKKKSYRCFNLGGLNLIQYDIGKITQTFILT